MFHTSHTPELASNSSAITCVQAPVRIHTSHTSEHAHSSSAVVHSHLCASSSVEPPLISTPSLAAMPVATITTVGVASPSAHGQAMTSTATVCSSASRKGLVPGERTRRWVTWCVQAATLQRTLANDENKEEGSCKQRIKIKGAAQG
jgi:hypothetical protein